MAVLNFDPTDYKIIEEFIFEESIQRDEALQFFMLDDQLIDAMEKLTPTGEESRFAKKQIRSLVRVLRFLYEKYITIVADGYDMKEPEYAKNISWIHPIYAPSALKSFSFMKEWATLHTREALMRMGYYRNMISALPRPFGPSQAGLIYPLEKPTVSVNANGIHPRIYLPPFVLTQTVHNSNGIDDLKEVSIDGSGDELSRIGFYAMDRGVDIPNPLPNHPFFSTSDPFKIDSTAPFGDLFPSMDAIMAHGVPITRDPYKHGKKYLNAYGIQLEDIPWSLWTSRFPQADEFMGAYAPEAISFKSYTALPPPDSLLKLYDMPYSKGIASRFWMMNMQDGGESIAHLLRSKAGLHGSVAQILGSDIPYPDYPATTIQDCSLDEIGFQDFLARGLLRQTWTTSKTDITTYTRKCVPIEFARQEYARLGYTGRLAWKETTSSELWKTYVQAFNSALPIRPYVPPQTQYAKYVSKDVSPLREEVEAVLDSDEYTDFDKHKTILFLLRSAIKNGEIYEDEDHLPIVCQHTIDVLNKDLEKDVDGFIRKWTAKQDGKYVCVHCGEIMTGLMNLVDQVVFDKSGHAQVHAEELEFKIAIPTESIHSLKSYFNLEEPADELFFQLLAILGVVPEISHLAPILAVGRETAKTIKVEQQGIVGIVQTVLLLQTHIPLLVPRRQFGTTRFRLNGYPRDTNDATEPTILESLFQLIVGSYSGVGKSLTVVNKLIINTIITKPEKVREIIVRIIDRTIEKNPSLRYSLDIAKEYSNSLGVEETPTFEPLFPAIDSPVLGTIHSFPKCGRPMVRWTNGKKVSCEQKEVPLRSPLLPAETRILVERPEQKDHFTKPVPDAVVRKRLGLFEKGMKLLTSWRANLVLASFLADTFRIPGIANKLRNVDLTVGDDMLRDVALGFVYECLAFVNDTATLKTRFLEMKTTNITLILLLFPLADAEEITLKLREKERHEFTRRMQKMTDMERAQNKELLDRGLIEHIITKQDRQEFADDIDAIDIGVGSPADYVDGDIPESGDYGDHPFRPEADDYNIAESQDADF